MSAANKTKKQSGSPAPHQSRATKASRPKRVPISGERNVITVEGKDPNYAYRWVKDESENGQRIYRYIQAAYEFVDATKSDYAVGDNFVYETHDIGSLIRKPAGDGLFLYLMRIPREFYEEDDRAKQLAITEQEQDIVRERDPHSKGDDGQYGKVQLS